MTTGVASATTWNVSPTGCNNTTCMPCCTIQAAVGHTVGNDVISVAPGTYVEQVDFRGMASVGDITLVAASGPGTVLVAPTSGHTLRHGDSHTNTVTIEGVEFTSAATFSCVYLNHAGNAVLRDVTANNCGYTAIMLDNPGTVTMERCTANNSDRTGIQIDGASSASLTDCSASFNDSDGISVYATGAIDLVNPTAVGNWDGISVDAVAPTTITGATVTGNGRDGINVEASSTLTITSPTTTGNGGQGINLLSHDSTTITNGTINNNDAKGIWAWPTATISIEGTTISGNFEQGIDIEWDGADPVDSVTLTNTDVSNNGHGSGDDGLRLRNVHGPVVITNCTFNDNGVSGSGGGFTAESDVVGDLEIYGGEANGNADDGYDLRVNGNVTVIGVTASGNVGDGVVTEISGTVFFQDCVANDNQTASGFDIQWQDPDRLDAASVIDCTANNNGLAGGGNGIRVKHVAGPVTVVGARTNGNYWTGVRVDDAANTVLIRDAVASFGLEEGFKVDVDIGPVTVLDCVAEGNALEGLVVRRETLDVESLYVRRNAFIANGGTGMALSDLVGSGLMSVQCNDVADNDFGLYLDAPVTVDARKVWWGHVSGPSSQGPGTGDGIYAEPGGTITYNPWLMQSITSPLTDCEMFGSGFESGLIEEWDVVVQ